MGLQAEKLAEIATLKVRVLGYPPALYAARRTLSEASAALEAIEADAKEYEAEIAAVVVGETTPDGKLRHPNDAARKAAVTRALATDTGARALAQQVTDAGRAKANAALDVGRIEDEQRAWRAVVDLTIAEISLLVAGR